MRLIYPQYAYLEALSFNIPHPSFTQGSLEQLSGQLVNGCTRAVILHQFYCLILRCNRGNSCVADAEECDCAAHVGKQVIGSHYILIMRSRCPRAQRPRNNSTQKITIINSNNITIAPFDPHRRNKSVQLVKKRRRASPSKQIKESVINEETVVFNLDEEMRRCREREVGVIRRNVALLKYYNCLLSLFMITYTACQVVASNFFQIRRQKYPLPQLPDQFGLSLINLLLTLYETGKNYQYESKLRRLALNILKVSPTASQFQRKAEFISRKVVLNGQKGREIEMSFVSVEVEDFWERLLGKVLISTQVEFMEEMFELEPERLCVRDFQALIEKYLSCDQFQADLKRHEALSYSSQMDSGSHEHTFSIEFLLIEKLCTEDYQEPLETTPCEAKKKKKYDCQIY